jgi:hypothetical protein
MVGVVQVSMVAFVRAMVAVGFIAVVWQVPGIGGLSGP